MKKQMKNETFLILYRDMVQPTPIIASVNSIV